MQYLIKQLDCGLRDKSHLSIEEGEVFVFLKQSAKPSYEVVLLGLSPTYLVPHHQSAVGLHLNEQLMSLEALLADCVDGHASKCLQVI